MSGGYEVARIDELEELPINGGEFVWRPVRRRFGISAFGTNAYTAAAGQRVVEEHEERDGHEEMYVVLRGRATFTVGDDEVAAQADDILVVPPETPHKFVNTGSERLRMTAIHHAASFDTHWLE